MNFFKRITFLGVLFLSLIISSEIIFIFEDKNTKFNYSNLLLFLSMIFGLCLCRKIENSKRDIIELYHEVFFWMFILSSSFVISLIVCALNKI